VRVFLRVAVWVVLGWSTGYVLAGQRAPDPYEALRDGKLTFWVSSRWTFDGEGLVAELKKDYPKLQVQWRAFSPDTILPAIETARQNGTLPDAVFAGQRCTGTPVDELRANEGDCWPATAWGSRLVDGLERCS